MENIRYKSSLVGETKLPDKTPYVNGKPSWLKNLSRAVVSFLFLFFIWKRCPNDTYNHLRSQHCNASWQGQFMYIAQLVPNTIFNT